MAVFNPFYNEETGWAAMDTLEPWQQALANPGARNPGMSMPGNANPSDPYYQFTQFGGGQPGVMPRGFDPYSVSNGIAGNPNWTGPNVTGSNFGGGTGPNAGPMTDPSTTFNNSNPLAIKQPGGMPGTNFIPPKQPSVLATPSLIKPSATSTLANKSPGAESMGMTGAQNVGGVGMYTGSNGPLDLNRFTPVNNQQPNGPPQGSIPTGDPNTWITPWGATYNTPGSVNNQTSADYDAWRQRTYGNMMGPQGQGPNTNPYSELTDALVRQPGSINAQTFQGYLNNLKQQQTGPYPPQQTAPRPPQGGGQPGYNPNYGQQGGSQRPGQTPAIGSSGMIGGGLGPSLNGYQTEGDMYDSLFGRGAAEFMAQQEQARIEDITSRLGLKYTPRGSLSQDLAPDPLGIGVDRRNYTMADGSPVNWNALTQQYGSGAFAASQMNRRGTNGFNAPSQYTPGSFFRNGQPTQSPVSGTLPPYGSSFYNQRGAGQQPNYQQTATQFSSDPAQQQAYMRDMFGDQQMDRYAGSVIPGGAGQQQVDFRAATFGGGSLFPAPSGSGSGNSNIPNTTNPSTSQYSQPSAGWGNATQRRSGFGGMSLFGNGMGGGNTGGQFGQSASQYRGAGSYGRPASFWQSQRPNF